MPFVVSKGSAQAILHPVRDLAGTALLTGKTTELGTAYTITEPDGTSVTTGLTWTEPNSDGWYSGTQTWSTEGTFHIQVDHSSSAPGGVQITSSDLGLYDYYVQVIQDAAGATPTGSYLTTVANLKEQLEVTGTADDAYYLNLIARATQRIERLVGRTLVQATYTEYHDGGSRSLDLRRGPIQSVTSVSHITYDTAGSETAEVQDAGSYRANGMAGEGWHNRGWIERVGSLWTKGQRNWKVIYSAGYSSVPYDLEQACLDLCVWYKNSRKDQANESRDTGAQVVSFRGAEELLVKLQSELWPYHDYRAA